MALVIHSHTFLNLLLLLPFLCTEVYGPVPRPFSPSLLLVSLSLCCHLIPSCKPRLGDHYDFRWRKERVIIKELNWTAFPSFLLFNYPFPPFPYKSIQYSVPTIDILPKGIETPPVAISRACFHLRNTPASLSHYYSYYYYYYFISFPFGREHKIVSSHRYPILRLACHRYSYRFFFFGLFWLQLFSRSWVGPVKGNLRALLFRAQRIIGKAKGSLLARTVFSFSFSVFINRYSALSSHCPIDRPVLQ